MSNLNNFEPQQLEPQKRVQNKKKKQNRRPEPRNHTEHPPIAPLFFGTMRLFWNFLDCTKGSPFICFDILQHNGCQKIPKGPPFYIFRHCDTVDKSHSWIFLEIFSSPQMAPLQFFSYFATSWSFTKPEGSLLQFWALDIAPTLPILGLFNYRRLAPFDWQLSSNSFVLRRILRWFWISAKIKLWEPKKQTLKRFWTLNISNFVIKHLKIIEEIFIYVCQSFNFTTFLRK